MRYNYTVGSIFFVLALALVGAIWLHGPAEGPFTEAVVTVSEGDD